MRCRVLRNDPTLTERPLISRYYTWSPSPINANIEFVPMLWGTDQIQEFTSTINKTIASNTVTAVLGMNESVMRPRTCQCSYSKTFTCFKATAVGSIQPDAAARRAALAAIFGAFEISRHTLGNPCTVKRTKRKDVVATILFHLW